MKRQITERLTNSKGLELKKYIPIPILLVCVTSIVTLVRLEPNETFLERWLPFYIMAILVVLPIALLVLKALNNLIRNKLNTISSWIQNLLFGVIMASTMGSLMTGASLFTQHKFVTFSMFAQQWGDGILNIMPFVLSLGLLIGLVVKPLIDRRKACLAFQKEHISS